MLKYCATSVRAVLNSVKDLVEALLDTARHPQVNSITGTVSAAAAAATLLTRVFLVSAIASLSNALSTRNHAVLCSAMTCYT